MITDLPDEESFKTEVHGSQLYSPDTKRTLLAIFREQCDLAVLLTEMVGIIFGTHGFSLPSSPSRDCFQARLVMLQKIRTSLSLRKETSPLSFLETLNPQK